MPLILDGLAVLALFILLLPLIYILGRMLMRRRLERFGQFIGALANFVDRLNDWVGNAAAWLALFMVLVQAVVVLQRYVFGVNFIWMQESVTYMHGLLFMLAAGYTLLHGGHVRVDIFYRDAPPQKKALIDFIGSYIFIFPVMILIFFLALPYVRLSWMVREGSLETSGIQGVYLLKSVILIFASLVLLQGLSLAARTALFLTGRDQHKIEAEESAQIF